MGEIIVSDFVAEPPERSEIPPPEVGVTPKAEGVSCKHCGKTFPNLGELGKHMWAPEPEGHREAMLKLQKEGLAEKAKERAEKKVKEAERGPAPQPEKEGIVKKGMEAKSILEQILDAHPDISDAAKKEVLSMADLQPLNPQLVAWCLSQLKGVSKETANYVSNKFALALQKAQAEALGGQAQPPPVMQPMQPLTQVPPTTYILTPQGYVPVSTQLPQQALGQPQIQPTQVQPLSIVTPQVPRPERSYKLVVDGQEIETDEKGFMAWKRYLDEQKKPSEKPPSALTKTEIEDIMLKNKTDLAGAFSETLKQDRAEREKETLTQVVKDLPRQISEAMGKTKSAEEKETLAQVVKDLPTLISEAMAKTKSAEELPKQIAEAVARAMPRPSPQPPTPPVTKEEIAAMTARAASEAAAKVVEAKAKEEAEQRRHGELLTTIRTGMAAQQTSGYKEDAYRFLGQGLSAAAAAIERKEPVKIVLEHAPEILRYTVPPSPKELAPGAAGEEVASHPHLKPEWIAQE